MHASESTFFVVVTSCYLCDYTFSTSTYIIRTRVSGSRVCIIPYLVGIMAVVNIYRYKVPLREEARGVAQERNEKHPA